MSSKILVIDDEEALCEILKYNLEKEGYEADCAHSAEEALDMPLETYSLFIVDIMMGGMSGFDFAKQLRNVTATEEKPILFCTALSDEDDVVKGLNIGADDYITKPFSRPPRWGWGAISVCVTQGCYTKHLLAPAFLLPA